MLPKAAVKQYQSHQKVSARALLLVRRLWARVGADFDSGFTRVKPAILRTVVSAQEQIYSNSEKYVPAVLYQTGQPDLPVASLRREAFVGVAGDNRPLDSLVEGAVVQSKLAVGRGATTEEALKRGSRYLETALLTSFADLERNVISAGIGIRPSITGYVRMLNPPSCDRCVILAGKWFRWNEGFQRHPNCDCIHIPAPETGSADIRVDPYAYFNSLSESEQERLFGRSNARAIRDGGDIYRVVNVSHRGLGTARAGAKWGTPTRATVDDIYRHAGTRTNALRLLQEHGYITGPQIAGGNIIGNYYQGFGQLGKGGTARAASDAVFEAIRTGQRDPLNRYTMTAAERNLYDAWYRQNMADQGLYPRSIGVNSADRWATNKAITPEQRQLVNLEYERQIAQLSTQPASVHRLAHALGIQ